MYKFMCVWMPPHVLCMYCMSFYAPVVCMLYFYTWATYKPSTRPVCREMDNVQIQKK